MQQNAAPSAISVWQAPGMSQNVSQCPTPEVFRQDLHDRPGRAMSRNVSECPSPEILRRGTVWAPSSLALCPLPSLADLSRRGTSPGVWDGCPLPPAGRVG